MFLQFVEDFTKKKKKGYGFIGILFLQVDSANKRGSLLEVVQVLTDLDLLIRRAYISSDGEWFMDG